MSESNNHLLRAKEAARINWNKCGELGVEPCGLCEHNREYGCWIAHYSFMLATSLDIRAQILIHFGYVYDSQFERCYRLAIKHNFPEYLALYDKMSMLR